MKILQFIIFFAVISCVRSERIKNGHNVTDPTKFPFFAMLIANLGNIGIKYCSASLIHPQWVLTAEHCLKEREKFDKIISQGAKGPDIIFMGNVYRASTPERVGRKVVEALRHSEHPGSHVNQDIALLKLHEPFTLSNTIKLIRLSVTYQECENIIFMGIGGTGSYLISDILKYTTLKIIHNEDVSGKGEHLIFAVHDSTKPSTVSLGGDSGGPTICDNATPPIQFGVLVGHLIKSDGNSYERIEKIATCLDFIKKHVPIDKYTQYLKEPKKEERPKQASGATKPKYIILCICLFFLCISIG